MSLKGFEVGQIWFNSNSAGYIPVVAFSISVACPLVAPWWLESYRKKVKKDIYGYVDLHQSQGHTWKP